jgi:DNA-binding transcriptional LysR family regulator
MARVALANVDLNLLIVLAVLLEERSVTAAARRLARTQSAISHSLGRLRELFDDPLFVRVGAGMQPTPRALLMRERLFELLGGVEGLVSAPTAFDPHTATLRVRIAASDYQQLVVLLPALARVRELAPGIDVEVAGPRSDLARALALAELDLGLTVGPVAAGLESEPLLDDRFVCVVGPKLRVRKLDAETYARLPHALVSPLGRPGGTVDDALAKLGLARRVAIVLPDFLTALRLVADTELILTLPERLVDVVGGGGLRRLPPPLELPSLHLGLAWHERVGQDPGIGWIRAQIRAACKALPRRRRRAHES